MDVQIESYNGTTFIASQSSKVIIRSADDILDLLAFGGEHQTNLFLLMETNFDSSFYDLRTGLAGEILQKFSNYRIRTAIVGSFVSVRSEKFREFMVESNKGDQLRFTSDKDSPRSWLTR